MWAKARFRKRCCANAVRSWQEKEFLHSHAKFGEELIRERLGDQRGAIYAHVARSHHERFDGNGTPDALAGQDIPLEARIVHVADAYDSLTHDRPWRKALPHDEVAIYLRTERSSQFDAQVVDSLLEVVKDAHSTVEALTISWSKSGAVRVRQSAPDAGEAAR